MDDLVAQAEVADEQRTKRVFLGFLSGVLGVDQTYLGDDAYVGSPSGQYRIANPDGSQSVQGQPYSNQQGVLSVPGFTIPPVLILVALAVAATLLAQKG